MLVTRAALMRQACGRSARTVGPARRAVAAARTEAALQARRRRELVRALDRLRSALVTCEAEFAGMSAPTQAEVVRGYGNDRADRVQTEIRRYEHAAADFLAAMGIRFPLPGEAPRLTG